MASTDTAVDSNDDFQPPRPKRKKPKGGLSALKSKWMSTKRCSEDRTLNSTLVGLSITWQRDYNTLCPEKPCPDDLLLSDSSSDVASWLEKYVLSTRKKTGEPYLPKMMYLLLCGLQR